MTRETRAMSWTGPGAIAVLTAVLALACSAEGADDDDGRGVPSGGSFGNASGSGGTGSGGFGSSGSGAGGTGAPVPPAGDGGQACAIASSAVELEPVHLAFAFDVSGSMGKGDE